MISKKLLSMLVALTMVVVLASCGSSGGASGDQGSGEQGGQKPRTSEEARKEQAAPKTSSEEETSSEETSSEETGSGDVAEKETTIPAPADSTLKLTIPEMSRVEDSTIPDALGTDEEQLRSHTAIHLRGTGFPWQEEANVYIAGHRLGYPNTDSYLAFYDLDKLEKGDEVILTDANGRKYTYEVFREAIVDPTDVQMIEPVEGKNIVSLQSCTLPDYSKRLLIQAELKA